MLRSFKGALAKLKPIPRLALLTLLCLVSEGAAIFFIVQISGDAAMPGDLTTANMERGSKIVNDFLFRIVPLLVLGGSLVGSAAAFLLAAPAGAALRAFPAALLVAVARVLVLLLAIPAALLLYWFGLDPVFAAVPIGLLSIIPAVLGSATLWRNSGTPRQGKEEFPGDVTGGA